MNAEIIHRLENSFAQVERLEKIFGGKENIAMFRKIAGQLGVVENQIRGCPQSNGSGTRLSGTDLGDALARAVPQFHKISVAWKTPNGLPAEFTSYANEKAMRSENKIEGPAP